MVKNSKKRTPFSNLSLGRFGAWNDSLRRLLPLPVLRPMSSRSIVNTVATVLALILTLAALGTALGAFFTLLSALLVLYFILTQIFGLSLEAGQIVVV